MTFVFQAPAKLEFFAAIAWYENQQLGLGQDFAREVIETLRRARLRPELFQKVRGRARKVRLRRFHAYSIYFAIKQDCFSVLAIFHGARNPKDLLRRFDKD
ncbi:MAG TPA: type II toxin-antitoxin system RelE/ParE family toxin [Verrucomicrobiae bacterium]|jgi:hypothetical protein|nr:type II toxin-antitoxin system RelE/ParE family toxin [Verrucomicrobiae bacterium]